MTVFSPASSIAVIGRQPIFDRRMRVSGYELLFRLDASADKASSTDEHQSTPRVIMTSFMEIGLENVVGSSFAFINVDRTFLLSDAVASLPKEQVVLEIIETVPPTSEVLARMQALVDSGYQLALDDFVYRDELEPMLDLARIVKLDISQHEPAALEALAATLCRRGLQLVAERVETNAELRWCLERDFGLFQGFFLERPETLRGGRTPDGNRLAALRTMALLNDPQATVDQLEEAIGRDVLLSYRLLRLMNSAAHAVARRVDSIRQAIIYLGRDTVRTWVTLLLLSGMNGKPTELLTMGLVRARMCERLAARLRPDHAHSAFTAGLFSVLDAVLDMPMEQLINLLPLTAEVSEALTAHRGPVGHLLSATIAYQRCDWSRVADLGMPSTDLRDCYLEAIRWAGGLNEAVSRV
jgi:EAL and modified HD-GYP domain-containing signal transduction protein